MKKTRISTYILMILLMVTLTSAFLSAAHHPLISMSLLILSSLILAVSFE